MLFLGYPLSLSAMAGALAAILSLAGSIPYIFTTITRKTHPNRVTWFLASLISGVTVVGYYQSHGGASLILPSINFGIQIIIFVLSLFRWIGWFRILDVTCLLFALGVLVIWAITQNPAIAIILINIVGCIAITPTIVKSYTHPTSENKAAWILWFFAGIVSTLSVSGGNPLLYTYSARIILTNGLILGGVFSAHILPAKKSE